MRTTSYNKNTIFQDPKFFDIVSAEMAVISDTAFKDYDLVIDAINARKNFVSVENAYLSLEGYLEHMKDKYKDLNISLEEDKKEEEKEPAKSKASDNGFFSKVKSVIKSILNFFYNLFVSIKDKFLSLFGINKKNKENQKAAVNKNFPETIKETEERIASIKKNMGKTTFADGDEYLDKYIKTGIIDMKYSPKSFNIGVKATEKEFNKAQEDVVSSVDTGKAIIAYYQNTASVLYANFTNIVESGKVNKEFMFDEVLTKSIDKINSVIDSSKFRIKLKDGSRVIGRVGNSFIVMYTETEEGSSGLPKVGTHFESSVEGDYTLTFNREVISVFNKNFSKVTDSTDSILKISSELIKSVEGYLKDIKAVVLKNEENMQDADVLKELKSIERFMNDILGRTGTIVKFCLSGKDFIFNTIEHMVKEDSNLSKKVQAYVSKTDKE